MWNPLKKNDEACRRLSDALEEAAAKHSGSMRVESLVEELSVEERKHFETCSDCRDAIQDLAATKELFQGVSSFAEEERPWFPARVMAAIASRERELAERVSAWTEFPRFASRLAWVGALVLLASTTWFYKSVVRAPNYAPAGSQESILEVPQQQAIPDDILVSKAGDNP
ncbi:MAG TPA: hypothetical protein VI431_02630 [Candidatus Acidoferrum sp.]